MAASGISISVLLLVLLQLTVGGNAASLEIWPSGDVQSKPIGSSLILTCQPNVSGQDVISDIRWLDPENRTIESRSAAAAATGTGANPSMSTEMHQPNSLKLYIYSLKENQAGRYTCVAKYAATETLQKSVMIETIEAIKWIDAPENQYPILGKEFKIKCHVSARPSPTVDWLHDGNLITTDDHYIIETHALKIKKVVESDEGIYTCRASVQMTGELQDRAIRVEVLEEPKIEEVLTEIEIIEGKTETIPCKASGKPAPKYTWVKYLTREDLSKTDRFGVDADTGLLTITNVNREDDGEYQCTAKNTAGEAQTIMKVAVIGKPKIMEFFNRTSPVGKTVELTCKAFGRPPPEVFFRKHTSEHQFKQGMQPDDDRILLKSVPSNNARDETVAVLTIENVLRKDDGLYECVAKNKVALAYKNGHLTVEYPPSFASMNNKTVWSWERRPVNLTCIAESIPNATIQWYMNGDRPVDLNDPMYQQIGNGPISTLVVQPVDRRYYAIYKCVAKNIHGTREHLIELKEAERPGHVQQARLSEITATTIAFEIVPPPTQPELQLRTVSVQYKENGQPWTNARNKTWSLGSPYVIEGLKPQTQYDFRFSARNDVGDGNWGANLVETTPQRNFPNPPRIQVRSGDALYEVSPFNNQYQLQWHAPPDNGEPIDLYEIRYCQVKRAGNDWELLEGSCIANEIKGQRTQQWLKDLNSDSFYRAEVRAHNVIGFSNPGIIHFKTARGENMPLVHKGPLISSAAIIGIVIAALIVVIVVIDVICCCTHKTGIIYYVCERSRKKPVDDEDTKLGSLYGWRFPLPYCDQKMANIAGVTAIQDTGNGKSTIKLVKHTPIEEKEPLKEEKKITPIIDSGLRRETSITFDGKRSVSKTGFVGKDSAV